MTISDDKVRAQRTWGDSPTGIGTAEGLTPGTRAHFERSLKWRSEVEQTWLPEVAPFHEWAGKRVLEVGHGPGYDAYSIMQAGADYTGVDITPENVERTRKALGLYGLKPNVQQGDAEALPFPANSFDVVYSNGVLHHTPDMAKAFSEAARVLKPGGRFYVILYHRNSVFYRLSLGLSWLARGARKGEPLNDQLRRIEYNGIGEMPLVNVYGGGELRRFLTAQGFRVSRISVRKLLAEDMPAARAFGSLYRRLPASLYHAAGKLWGWYVCAEAMKP